MLDVYHELLKSQVRLIVMILQEIMTMCLFLLKLMVLSLMEYHPMQKALTIKMSMWRYEANIK